MKKHILVFCMMIISLFFINLNVVSAGGSNDDAVEEVPSKKEDKYQATIRCEYELEYPEAYITNLFNGSYSIDEVKKICESGQNALYPDPEACLDKFVNNKVLTTIYIEGYKSGDSFIDCYRSGACKVTYISNKTAATPLDGTSVGSTVTTNNMNGVSGYYVLKEMKSGLDAEDIKTNPNVSMKPSDYLNASEFNGVTLEEDLDAWYSKFKGNNCPNIHLYFDLNTRTVKISGQTYDNYYKYHREIQKKEMYKYNPEEEDISDKPVDPNNQELESKGFCDNFTFIGSGTLAGKTIDLKMKIEMLVDEVSIPSYNLTFTSGKNSKTFKGVYEDNLEYYPINFNVGGIGSNINLFVSEDSEDGIMLQNFVNPAACMGGKELYIYPYIYTDSKGNKVDVYKIAYSDREYGIDVGKGNSPELQKINYNKVTCVTLFGSDGSRNSTHGLLKMAIRFIQYLGVILALVLSVLDFIKVIPTQDKDMLRKSIMKTVTRLGVAIAIFLVPVLLKFLLKLIGISDPLCGLI